MPVIIFVKMNFKTLVFAIISILEILETSSREIYEIGCFDDYLFEQDDQGMSIYETYVPEDEFQTISCIFECDRMNSNYMMFTSDNNCICMDEVGYLDELPCSEIQSVVLHFGEQKISIM